MDERGWSRAELARQAKINRAYVTDYLNSGVVPSVGTRQKLASALGVSVEEVNRAADASPTHGVFELSPAREADAQTLDRSQSELIYEIIRHLAEGNRRRDPIMTMEEAGGGLEGTERFMERSKEQEEVGRHGDAAPNRQAAGSAATEEYEPTLDRLKYGRSVALKLAKLADDIHQGQADFLWPHLQQVMQQSSDPEDFDQKLEEMIAEYAGDAALRDARQDAAEHYDLAADESIHQGDHGRIGPDDIEHST